MKIKKYFVIPLLAFLASSCQDEEQASIQPATGDEVRFGASLEQNATTRTIYGEVQNNNAFPIYWVNGDKVLVYSPQCVPITNAIYQVSAGEQQNYATSLDKTGENGLQWGESPTADFYSVYPAIDQNSEDPSGAEIRNGNSVVLTMPAQQDNGYVNNNGTLTVQPDMRACFMVANTPDVQSGSTVELQYTPLSTAVRFTLQGPTENEPVGINYVRLYAPVGTNINGTFTADFSTVDSNGLPKLTATNGRRYVTFNVADEHGTYLTLRSGESIELNAFLLLEGETTITSEWYIEVGTTGGQSFIKYLDDSSTNVTLVPGKIHRLAGTLPPLTPQEWDPANWMTNLQRNVYLSEISIPGSWYSLHNDYQMRTADQTFRDMIVAQYNAGVRAFHLDTRWRGTTRSVIGDTYLDEVQDLGVLDDEDHSFNEYGVTGGDKYITMDAPSFTEALSQITTEVQNDEYMVVICTFAQGSANPEGYDWRQAISNACARNNKIIEAKTLTENSVVQDVLGHVIVIVNTYTPDEVPNSKCMFFDMGITLDASDWDLTTHPYYQSPLIFDNSQSQLSGITMYGTHAQATVEGNSGETNDRGYMPTFGEREAMVQNILNWSSRNYADIDNYAHNAWMYIGLGGYVPASWALDRDDYSIVSRTLNPWIDNIVTNMDNSSIYYPVGIVLMNHATNYGTVVNSILQLNNKYRKAYDPNRSPVDGSDIDDNGTGVQSVAPGYSSGMVDNHTNAIGWTRSR